MEIGVGMFGDIASPLVSGKPASAGQRIQELIREIQYCDEVGLDVFAMGEHHRQDYAVAVPNIILAAAAGITQHIRLSTGVTVLSSFDPVLLYEEFAAIDLISKGRAEIMVGRGSFIESFPLYGYSLSDYDGLFEEKLDLLLKINREDPVSWSGKYRAPLDKQKIFPRAFQPELPVWVAVGGTPASVERAARLGLPLIVAIIGGQPEQYKPLFEYYKELYARHGHPPEQMQIGIHAHTFAGEDNEEVARKYFPYYAAQMNNIGRDRGWPPYTREQFDYGRSMAGHLLVGDANLVAEKILQLKEIGSLTRFIAHLDVGGPDHKDMMKAIEILGTKVLPQLKHG